MNVELMQQISRAVTTEVLTDWKFYAIVTGLQIIFGAAAAVATSYLAKRGELRAVQTDITLVLSQLKQTTEVAKKVELRLSQTDWLERERNGKMREKLELLVTEAFRFQRWIQDLQVAVLMGRDNEMDFDKPELDEFEMYSALYFADMAEATELHAAFSTARVYLLNLRLERMPLQLEFERAAPDSEEMLQSHNALMQFADQHRVRTIDLTLKLKDTLSEFVAASRQRMQALHTITN